jgi:hypothetical protein
LPVCNNATRVFIIVNGPLLEGTMLSISSYLRRGVTPVVCASLVLLAGKSEAQNPWTVSGSTGIVDEADTSEVRFDTAAVGFRPTAPAQSIAVIRYPVSQVIAPGCLRLSMSYERPDDWSYAAATLKRIQLTDGATSVVTSVNAWEQPPAANTQIIERETPHGWDYSLFAYYVEVVLWKPEATNNPRVVGLRVYVRSAGC